MITSYVHALILLMFRDNCSCNMSCIASNLQHVSFYKFCFVLVFVDLTLFVLFLSVFKKIQKPIKF